MKKVVKGIIAVFNLKFLLLTSYFLIPTSLSAQTPEWVYQHVNPGFSDVPYAIAVDSAGNTYTTGYTRVGSNGSGLGIIKLSTMGEERWFYYLDTLGPGETGRDIVFRSGYVYVTGYTASGTGNLIVVCVDSIGQSRWLYLDTLDTEGLAIDVSPSGNVYVAGKTQISLLDWVILKLDSLGNEVWRYVYDGPAGSYDEALDITIDRNENIYVGGYSTGIGTNTDFTVIKLDSAGQEQWVYRYDGPVSNRDEGVGVALAPGGDIYVVGSSRGNNWDYCVIRLDSLGQERWVYRYDGLEHGSDMVYGFVVDDTGNIYVSGFTTSQETLFLFTVIKVDSLGSERWRYLSAGPIGSGGIADEMALDGLGGVYVSGKLDGYLAVVKLSNSGNEDWVYRDPYALIARDIVADVTNNIYVVGEKRVSIWDYDIVVMKFASSQGRIKEVVCNERVKRNLNTTIFKGGIEFVPQENCGLKVYDVMGRLVIERILHQKQKVFIPLQPGVYFLRVEGGKDGVIKKIIIL